MSPAILLTLEEHVVLRERLRALPTLARPGLPVLDPDAAPSNPHDLFVTWIDDAIEAGAGRAGRTSSHDRIVRAPPAW